MIRYYQSSNSDAILCLLLWIFWYQLTELICQAFELTSVMPPQLHKLEVSSEHIKAPSEFTFGLCYQGNMKEVILKGL